MAKSSQLVTSIAALPASNDIDSKQMLRLALVGYLVGLHVDGERSNEDIGF
jgi:hypothetical protein